MCGEFAEIRCPVCEVVFGETILNRNIAKLYDECKLAMAVLLLLFSSYSFAQVISAPLPVLSLKAGWNLVGNSSNKAIDVSAVFASKSNEVQTVWHWNTATSNWDFYTPSITVNSATYAVSSGYGDLKSISVGDGFWVNVVATNGLQLSLPYEGSTKTRMVTSTPVSNFKFGWNLAVNHSNKAIDVAALYGAVTQVSSVWKWNGTTGTWDFYSPQLPAVDLASYASLNGYGVLASIGVSEGYWVSAVDAKQVALAYDMLPLPVYASSYENANSVLNDNPTIPSFLMTMGWTWEQYSANKLATGEQDWFERSLEFADFLRDGTLSAVVTIARHKNLYPSYNPGNFPDSPAKVFILKKDLKTGKWSDASAQVFKDDSNRYICITPSYTEVADLNGDGQPDAYFSCTGIDFVHPEQSLEIDYQYAMLSQPDGTYKIDRLPIGRIYSHQAALADIDGDNNIDIVTLDPKVNNTPFIMWGKGDGTFTKDTTRFPGDVQNKSIWAIYAIPVKDKVNIIVSGVTAESFPLIGRQQWMYDTSYGLKILQYDGSKLQTVLDFTKNLPNTMSNNLKYNLATDIVYKDGYYYALQVGESYSNTAIVKYEATTGDSMKLYETLSGCGTECGAGISRIKITSKNEIVAKTAGCDFPVMPKTWKYNICSFNLPLH